MQFDVLESSGSWLTDEGIDNARANLPIVYVDAIPVRVNSSGAVTEIGLLLRALPDGSISRAVVSGRVLYRERIRDALMRHLEKDLGPFAFPKLPASPQPFTVVEYFPDASVTGFHDPRQHAISLAFIVPIEGECAPSQDSLDLIWVTPQSATSSEFEVEMVGGQGRLVRMALAHVGLLP
jgi:ADP-ribose pyrophosphatase YjhB (NUDIX family)